MMKKILAALLSLVMLMPCASAEEIRVSSGAIKAAAAVRSAVRTEPAAADEAALPAEAAVEGMNLPGELSGAMEELIPLIAERLQDQDYALDIVAEDGTRTVRVDSDGEAILVEVAGDDMNPVRIVLTGTEISDLAGEESYTYGELLNMLLDFSGSDISGPAMDLIGSLDERDLEFLQTAGGLAYSALTGAGAVPVVKSVGGDTYFSMSITPDLMEVAAVRFIERLLDCEAEIDSLIVRVEPLLRELVPELYRTYDAETGAYVRREGYTCAELRELFDEWLTRDWLDSWVEFEGMHLDISGRTDDEDWSADVSFLMPGDGISLWLELSGGDDEFGGTLEYCAEGYSRAAERYEMQSYRFEMDGKITDSGMSLRVKPETPLEGFTGLRIDFAADSDGFILDAVTDVLDFRAAGSHYTLDVSAAVMDILLDVHLSGYSGFPQGYLIGRSYRDGVYLRLYAPE